MGPAGKINPPPLLLTLASQTSNHHCTVHQGAIHQPHKKTTWITNHSKEAVRAVATIVRHPLPSLTLESCCDLLPRTLSSLHFTSLHDLPAFQAVFASPTPQHSSRRANSLLGGDPGHLSRDCPTKGSPVNIPRYFHHNQHPLTKTFSDMLQLRPAGTSLP